MLLLLAFRKRAEQSLRNSEKKVRVLADTAVDAIISADTYGNLIQFNRAAEIVFGYSDREILGRPLTLLLPKRFREECLDGIQRFLKSGQGQMIGKTTEIIGLRKNGTEFPLEISLSAWETSEGKFFTAILRDIASRKQLEDNLREREEFFCLISESMSDMIAVLNRDGKRLYNSPSYAALLGDPAKLLGTDSFAEIHPDDRESIKRIFTETISTGIGRRAEFRFICPDGTIRFIESQGNVIKDKTGEASKVVVVSRDITERKEAREQLRQSEELLRTTTEGARIGLWSWDIERDAVKWNSVEYEQFGLPSNTKIDLSVFINCVHPDDRRKLKAAIEKCLASGGELNIEHRILWPDGTVRWNQCKGQISYANGRPESLSGMSLDITERRQAEDILRQHAELLNLAQVLVFDLNDKILFWNRGTERLYGWSKQEAIGKNVHDLLRTEFPAPFDEIKTQLFRKNQWEGELIHFRKNGEKIFVASHWAVHKDSQNRPVAILQSDNNITELKNAEKALQKAKIALGERAHQLEQRVESRTDQLQKSLKDMESFCYTIAHDLKAPLRALSGFSKFLETDHAAQLNETGREYCARINASANRMSHLISDLLVYGELTHRELPTRAVNLAKEIDKVLERTAPQIEESHAQIAVDKPLPEVCGNAPVLDQVLENLITNAVKFVPSERQPHIHIFAEHRNNKVRLCVEDNGIGVPPEYRQQIFRPFERLHAAATYPGTGIGLAIVQKGVEKMGGHVGVEPAPHEGSRFWLELPDQCGATNK